MAMTPEQRKEYDRKRGTRKEAKQAPQQSNLLSKEQEDIQDALTSFATSRKRLEKAIKKSVPGTQTFLAYSKQLADLDSQLRDFKVERGLSPANLQTSGQTHFSYVAHVPEMPSDASPEVVRETVKQRDAKAAKGQHNTPEDNVIRKQLNDEFGTGGDWK